MGALCVQGCGGPADTEMSQQQASSGGLRVEAASELMVRSPALENGHASEKLPLRYRCSESFIWLPLEWGTVPEGTSEVVVTIVARTLHRRGNAVSSELFSEWVIGGLSPGTHVLYPGPLPSGAFVTGHNVNISNCPPRSQETGFVFTVIALPEGHQLQNIDSIDLSTIEDLEARALAKGYVLATYGNG